MQLIDRERGRLDHSRWRPADGPATFAEAHQMVTGINSAICSARRRTERPGRSRSPFQPHRSGLVGPTLTLPLGNPNAPKMLLTRFGQLLAWLSVHEFLAVVAQELKLLPAFVGIKDNGLRVQAF